MHSDNMGIMVIHRQLNSSNNGALAVQLPRRMSPTLVASASRCILKSTA
jgi:hypothetical protein